MTQKIALTSPGMVNVGDEVEFEIAGNTIVAKVADVLNPGTDTEEIIYDLENNHYFITSMVLAGQSGHRNVFVIQSALTRAILNSYIESREISSRSVVEVPEELRQRLAEVLEWKKTGLLKEAGALRVFADQQPHAEVADALRMAEDDTLREAAELVLIGLSGVGTNKPSLLSLLAPDHQGMRLNYRGFLSKAIKSLELGIKDTSSAEGLSQLEEHLTEFGQRFYAGDYKVADEILQLYCIEREARTAITNSIQG